MCVILDFYLWSAYTDSDTETVKVTTDVNGMGRDGTEPVISSETKTLNIGSVNEAV